VIDIHDVAIVASSFNTWLPADGRADINGDEIVDIFDLVLCGLNYGKTESPW